MAIKPTEKIWHNGKLINWEDAKIHVLSVGSSRVDLQACKLEYSIVSPK